MACWPGDSLADHREAQSPETDAHTGAQLVLDQRAKGTEGPEALGSTWMETGANLERVTQTNIQ